MFERYVDDSNQIWVVPPKGARNDKNTKKIVVDPGQQEDESQPDERLAKDLADVSN